MDKKDYLKKYLSKSKDDKKKKRRKVITTSATIRKSKIVDDDIDLSKLQPIGENELDIYDLAEDAPQVAGIIDDRPEEVKVLSKYKETKKWKIVTREYEDVEVSAVRGAGSDSSPPRKNRQRNIDSDSDVSVERKGRRVDSDESPPRRPKEDPSRKRPARKDSDGDLSPPRKSDRKKDDVKTSSHSKSKKRGSDTDGSPPRQSYKRGFDEDRRVSPPKRIKDDDLSPPRKARGRPSHETREPAHKSRDSKHVDRHDDRRERRRDDDRRESSDRKKKSHHDSEKKTLDGKKAGLQNAADMKKEAEKLRQMQAESLAKLGDDVSGRGAATIMRDKKTGKIRDFREEARQKREKDAKAAEIVEQYAVWGKGMKQIEERAERMKSDTHEMSKPVARYADDFDLEEMRRNEEKDGDPMLEYMRNKRKKEGKTVNVKQMYHGSFNPNRYNIRPGHRWDGVDRSNGYEKQWFEEKSNRKALEEEAFKWSTEDM